MSLRVICNVKRVKVFTKVDLYKAYPTDSQWPKRSILTWVLMQRRSDQGEIWVRLSWHHLGPAWGRAAEERCSEFIEDVLGRDLRQRPDRRADWVEEREVVWFKKNRDERGLSLSYHRPAAGHILAIYLSKQPERVGHGGPSSKSISNRPCARAVREAVINSLKHQC